MQAMNLKIPTDRTLAIIMGGGAGTRLFPLTKERAKPAVPLGGKYRLVDIPISNCLNSGFRQVYVLTQFNSESLHRHITASYKFDNFTKSFVEILAAQQTPEGARWYQGTADAVRQNLRYFLERFRMSNLPKANSNGRRMPFGRGSRPTLQLLTEQFPIGMISTFPRLARGQAGRLSCAT